jgi:hypothetical protein
MTSKHDDARSDCRCRPSVAVEFQCSELATPHRSKISKIFWINKSNQEGGKPVTKTRTFQHPVSEEELESVWDEQTLRLLLEQSTDYEERRQIRARLRQVMAEQEACTELVEKASQDQIGTTFEGATHVKKTFTEGPVTTSQGKYNASNSFCILE